MSRIVSPDAPAVCAFIDAVERRARRLAALEMCGWALGAAGVATGAALTMHAPPRVVFALALLTAFAAAGLWMTVRGRNRASRSAVVARVERALPGLRNLLTTSSELLQGPDGDPAGAPRLYAPAPVRARVFADASKVLTSVDPRAAISNASAIRAAAAGICVWLIVAAGAAAKTARMASSSRTVSPPAASITPAAAGAAGRLRVTATIQPPDYTRLAGETLVNPAQIHAVQGSTLTLAIAAAGDRATVEHDGAVRALARGVDGLYHDRFPLANTGFLIVSSADGGKRIVPLVIAPDALPVVRLTAPGRDLIYSVGNPRIQFDARATDDFGIRALALRYTKVSGSGEQFEFKEGTIPLTIARASPRDWQGTAARALVDLDLQEGDMLVYRAVASDARPGDGSASSDAFFIEISKLGAAAGEAFTLPEEETRYALSQQMLIVKTERLLKAQTTMPSSAVAEAALNLAVEQRMIRAEFVFMLGGEVQDEEVEAQESTELQEGRQQNRGQRDVRAATQAMSVAGKYLTGVELTPALAAERAAVAALQRAFSKDRYILRALATRSQLDMTRRLTGDVSQAADWRRRRADAPANRRAALLQDVLQALGGVTAANAALPSSTGVAAHGVTSGEQDDARQQILVLAGQALRIDPDSTNLRQAAADLQTIADTWQVSPAGARANALDAVAAHVAKEAAKALAAAPSDTRSAAPGLRGAFADAQHARGAAR